MERPILEPRSLRAQARRSARCPPVAVNTTASPELAVGWWRDLAAAQTHLHQAAQAASLLKCEVAVSRSHGDPGQQEAYLLVQGDAAQDAVLNRQQLSLSEQGIRYYTCFINYSSQCGAHDEVASSS